MNISYLKPINHTVDLTHAWIQELTYRVDWADYRRSYRLLRVTLQTLRDWLSVEEATDLGAQLPTLIRGLYYEGWNPVKTPVKHRKKQDFIDSVSQAFTWTLKALQRKCQIYGQGCLRRGKVQEGERYLALPDKCRRKA